MCTAVHGAAQWGLDDAIKLLAANGADLNVKDSSGLTPLDAALGKGANGRITGTVRPKTAELIRDLIAGKKP